jgi:hypothetical protein
MARTFGIQDVMTVAEVVFNFADIANHPMNSFDEPTHVSLYAAASVADVEILSLQLGDQLHSQNLRVPVNAAVSTRDHLVGQGIIMPGQRIGLSYRAVGAGTPTLNGIVVLSEVE